MRKLALFLTFTSLLCLSNCLQSPQSPKVQTPAYQNPDYTAKERARDLVGRMTLEEKLAQFTGSMKPVESDPGVGTFGFMTMHLPIREAVEEYNTLQRHQIGNTRLGIPASRSGEGIFAHMGNGSTSFPLTWIWQWNRKHSSRNWRNWTNLWWWCCKAVRSSPCATGSMRWML